MLDKFTGTLVVAETAVTSIYKQTRYRQVKRKLEQQDWKCAYCEKRCSGILAGAPTPKGLSQAQLSRLATMDHIVPRSQGGTNKLENQVAVCFACNQGKADKSLKQFLAEINQWERFVHSSLGFRYLQHIQNELYMNTISIKEGNESMPKFAALARFTNRQIDKSHMEEETRRSSEFNEAQKTDVIQSIKDVVDEYPGLSKKELLFRLHEGGVADAYSIVNKMVNDGLIKRLYIDGYWRYYPINHKINEVTVTSQKRDTGRNMQEAVRHAREHSGETIQELTRLLTKAPGLTYDEIETALGRIVGVKMYVDRGILERTQIPGSKVFRYFVKGQVPKGESQSKGLSIYSRSKAVLEQTPWLTQKELQEAVGVSHILVTNYFKDRKLKRVKTPDGLYRYALPRTPLPGTSPTNKEDEFVKAVERFDKAIGEETPKKLPAVRGPIVLPDSVEKLTSSREVEPENDLFHRIVERAKSGPFIYTDEQIAKAVEDLAMKYHWESNDFDLKKFVAWLKKPVVTADKEGTKE